MTPSWLRNELRNCYDRYSNDLHYIYTRLIKVAKMKFVNFCVHSIKNYWWLSKWCVSFFARYITVLFYGSAKQLFWYDIWYITLLLDTLLLFGWRWRIYFVIFWIEIYRRCPHMASLSHSLYCVPGLAPRIIFFILRATGLSNKLLEQIRQGTLEIVIEEVLLSFFMKTALDSSASEAQLATNRIAVRR